MKTKTILELLTLSSTLYYIARDSHLLEHAGDLTKKGKDGLNKLMADSELDENGNKIEFVDRIIAKTHELKQELDDKIEEQIVKFYKKINVAHLDEIKALNKKIEKLDATVALLEAKLNHLES